METNRRSINFGKVFSAVGRVILVALVSSVLFAIFWTIFGPWEWRARVLSYIPCALIVGHGVIFFLAMVRPRFWGVFKGYFLVTFLVYFSFLIYFLKIINSSDYGNPLALLALPIAPFGLPDYVEKLIDHRHERERENAIASGSISLETIILQEGSLAEEEKRGIYRRLKEGADISPDLIEKLLFKLYPHRDNSLISLLLGHPNITADTIRQYHAQDAGTYRGLLQNPNTPVDLIEEMVKSNDFHLVKSAVGTGRVEAGLVRESFWNIVRSPNDRKHIFQKHFVAESDLVTIGMLEAMVGIDGSLDREIAESKITTPEMLARFASHESFSVRYAVANNSKTPREAYYKLIHEEGDALKLQGPFMRNPHVPEDIKSMVRKMKSETPELNKRLESEWRSKGLAPQDK